MVRSEPERNYRALRLTVIRLGKRKMRIHGLKVVGLSLTAAIGLMAFTATAQAAED
jgi:hypothetical protein